MNAFSIPPLDGYKTLIGSYVQLVVGLLMAVVQFLNLFLDCLNGITPLAACFNNLPLLFLGVIAAANGLMGLGLGHKVQNVEEAVGSPVVKKA